MSAKKSAAHSFSDDSHQVKTALLHHFAFEMLIQFFWLEVHRILLRRQWIVQCKLLKRFKFTLESLRQSQLSQELRFRLKFTRSVVLFTAESIENAVLHLLGSCFGILDVCQFTELDVRE